MNKATWSATTKTIFNGILLFSLAWIAYGIFNAIGSLIFSSTVSVITYLLLAGIGVGYILTIIGLGKFSAILDEADKKAIGSVRVAFIVALVAVVLNAISLIPGIVGDIVYFIAIVLMMLKYGSLKRSTTFAGRAGASTLYTAMLLLVLGWALDFIPVVGDWIESVLTIIAYIMTLQGWGKIKNVAVAG
jgi:hypothetical protein